MLAAPSRGVQAVKCERSSGKGFTLDSLTARDRIIIEVEASFHLLVNWRQLLLLLGRFPNPLFVLRALFAYALGQSVLTNRTRARRTESPRHAPPLFLEITS